MTELQPYGKYQGLGLEDIKQSDLVTPRLSIDHKNNRFVNSLSKTEYETVKVILLSPVKQRIMWPPEVDDSPNAAPQCKSTDFEIGFPNTDPKAPADKLFPWLESGFDPSGAQGAYMPELFDEIGLAALPCSSCVFKEWKNGKTRCKEQHSYPLLIVDDSGQMPAILTLQGSGIAPSKAYVSPFGATGQPLFTRYTTISLKQEKRGKNEYSVPVFRDGGPTDPAMHDEYAVQVPAMRDFLRRPPVRRGDSHDDETVAVTPAQAVAQNVAQPVAVPVPSAVPATQHQVIEHVAAPEPVATPAPVPVAVPPSPVPPPVPVAVPAAVEPVAVPVAAVPTPTEVQAVTPAAVPAVAVEGGDDDGLPF